MQKEKEIFQQAQERGWVESGDVDIIAPYVNDSGILVLQIYFIEQDVIKHYTLNDILFGTDFCEKFFPEICQSCVCRPDVNSHKIYMLSMSQSERIEFLEKHLEVKEEENLKIFHDHGERKIIDGSTWIPSHVEEDIGPISKEKVEKWVAATHLARAVMGTHPSKVYSHTFGEEEMLNTEGTICKHSFQTDYPHRCMNCGEKFSGTTQDSLVEPFSTEGMQQIKEALASTSEYQTQVKEIEHISKITLDRINGVTTFSLESRNDILNKLNELVDAFNAQQKQIDAIAKDCKLNRN